MISEYLNQSLATDDLSSVVAALAAIVKAQNVLKTLPYAARPSTERFGKMETRS